jgi:uncharacterized protein YceH (UPF0502 family)
MSAMSTDTEAAEPMLSPAEARILASLMEKQRTTPDQYPLTLNALSVACNQKTCRDPVMNMEVGEVGHLVNTLRDRGLIHASFAGRTERYDHKMASSFRLDRQEQAVLCVLMLRGPQTLGELRINTGRMAEFADLPAMAEAIRRLSERDDPLVTQLPHAPGKREDRFAHLLCGTPTQDVPSPAAAKAQTTAAPAGRTDARDERVAALAAQVVALRAEVEALWELTGLAERRPRDPTGTAAGEAAAD